MSEAAWVLTLGTAALFILGMPIVFAIGIASLGALVLADVDIVILGQKMIQGSTIFSLLAVPCFILAGDIMQTGGLASRLINVARVLVRHLTGGLGMVTVLSATFFAALSGSSPATTAAIGSIMIPEMERRGYRRDFSTALAASAGPLGQMIPPSIPMVIWGVISETSITALFFAGIVPGLLTSCGLMAVCYWVARAQGVLGDEHRASGRELVAAIADGKWALLTPLIILGGIYGGVFTPTEAGAVAVAYSLVIGVFVHREMKLSDLPGILLKSMRTTAIAVFILTTALCFGFLIALEDLPGRVTELLFSVSDDPVVVLLMLNLLLLIIGAFMDTISAMVILATVLIAIGAQLGLDPVHLGAIIVINLAIGFLTPPFGINLFVGAAISGLRVEAIAKAIWPMLLVEILVLLAVTYFPAVTLTIPRLLQ